MSCGAMHEFALVLDKAGFTAGIVHEIVNSRGNKMAKTMLTSVQTEASTEKFSLLVDLGIITVPNDYDHATALDKFLKKNRKKFYGINDNITIDVNIFIPWINHNAFS